jgi:hypothetical protein
MAPKALLSALLASTAAFLLLAQGHSLANGESVEIFRGREGAYELIVGVQPETPVVGAIHFTITPLDIETSLPVVDAEISVVAHDPDGKAAYRVRAVNTPLAARYYDANITIESPGTWTLAVEVSSDRLGRATFAVPVKVGAGPVARILAGTVVWLAVVTVLATGATVLWLRTRKRLGRA